MPRRLGQHFLRPWAVARLLEAIGQLQGFHAPAGAWEREILPARVAGYDPALLDQLCLSGEVAWGRLVVAGARGGSEAPQRPHPLADGVEEHQDHHRGAAR